MPERETPKKEISLTELLIVAGTLSFVILKVLQSIELVNLRSKPELSFFIIGVVVFLSLKITEYDQVCALQQDAADEEAQERHWCRRLGIPEPGHDVDEAAELENVYTELYLRDVDIV